MLYENDIAPPKCGESAARSAGRNRLSAKLQVAGLDINRAGVSKIEERLRFDNDKDIMFLAEVLKAPVQELFPQREGAGSKARPVVKFQLRHNLTGC